MNRLPRFRLHEPQSVDEALVTLAHWGEDAAVLMGGTELLPLLKLGLASAGHLVDCRSLTDHLRAEGQTLVIGSGVTHRRLELDPLVKSSLPELVTLERELANVRVRNVGTIGGNLCFAEPRSDPATLFLALGATAELASTRGRRSVELDDFFLGPFVTEREPDELMTEIQVPLPAHGDIVGFRRLAIGERPVANVAFKIDHLVARIAIGAVGLQVTRAIRAEEILTRSGSDGIAAAAEAAAVEVETVSDVDGSDEYKRHLVEVLLRRALTEAYERRL